MDNNEYGAREHENGRQVNDPAALAVKRTGEIPRMRGSQGDSAA